MCGIFGIINSEKKNFDYQTFCTLGICNDDRGGDSCGVFIDGKYEYGVNENKLFSEFYRKSKVIQEARSCNIALGHCRKASIGAINEKTAQPVVIEEDGVVKFVVIHNGTIYDYVELAKKYIPDVDITGMTDSQVMARIFYYAGYDVLKEYSGGAAFVAVDYRQEKPEIMMFKGASLVSLTSQVPTEERPLYLVMGGGTLIFSSISKFLRTKKKYETLYTCPQNKLCRINDNGELEEVQVYDRSEMYQFRHTYSTSKYNNDDWDSWTGGEYYHRKYNPNAYGYQDNGKSKNNSYPINNHSNNSSLLLVEGNKENKKAKNGNLNKDYYIESNDDGTYNIQGVLAQGYFFINDKGKIVSSQERNNDRVHIFFFWQGVMLYNKECFKFLKKLSKTYGLTEGQLIEDYPLLVHYLSPDPFKDDQLFEDQATYVAMSDSDYKVVSSCQWQYFMSKNVYWFNKDGLITASWESTPDRVKSTFDDYIRLGDKTYLDFAFLIDEFGVY